MKQRVVKLCIRSVSLALVTLLVTSITTNAQQYSASSPRSIGMEAPSAMASVPQQINQIRLGANLPALTASPLLQQAAQMHALDMITYGNWGHIGTDGSRVGDRINRIGYFVDGWAGENWVSAVNSTSALNWWMRSPAHRDNILSSAWQDFGVGSVVDPASGRTIYVAVFATGRQMVSNAPALAVQSPAAPQPTHVQPTLSVGGPSPRTATSTIKAGDTLFGLATQFRIPWTELASLNGWSEETILQLGQEFVIPTAAYAYIPITGSNSAKEFTEAYRVQPGDTLFTIAQDFQIDWPVIAHVNGLDNPDMLQIGQRLLLPSSAKSVEPSVQPHIVKAGDTVISIAAKYKVGWKTLLQINGLSESTILQIGQELRIENGGNF